MTDYKSKEDAVKLLARYNPTEQVKFACYPERCVCGISPTLAEINRDYGEDIVIKWIVIELRDYNEFIGVREEGKNSLETILEVARMILSRYYYLKLPEIMLFFQKMKSYDYGEMYGCVDAARILKMLNMFLTDRAVILERKEKREREEQACEHRKHAVSYEQYQELRRAKGLCTG